MPCPYVNGCFHMSKLFILGSGFSKAVSSHMPTIRELAQHIETRLDQLPGDHRVYRRLLADPEGLLTYLFQAMPWKSPEETHVDRAAFIVLSRQIAEYLKECEAKAFGQAPPQWAVDFVQYLHF